MIKTFKAKIAVGDTQRIRLSTNNGLTGYKIRKFQVISSTPGTTASVEYIAKVFAIDPGAANAQVNFDDPTLLAVAYYENRANASSGTETIIIDDKKFNQDIYVTLKDSDAAATLAGNFYLELEEFKLSLDEATVSTLKDMRGSE